MSTHPRQATELGDRRSDGRGLSVLLALVGAALVLAGASAQLWLVLDDRLPTTMARPAPEDLALWAAVRPASGAVLAGGAWLLALAVVRLRRGQRRQVPEPGPSAP